MGTYNIIKCIGSLSVVPGTELLKPLDFLSDSSVFCYSNEPLQPCIFLNNLLIFYFWLCWFFVLLRLFSSCGSEGYSLVSVLGLLTAAASLAAERRL